MHNNHSIGGYLSYIVVHRRFSPTLSSVLFLYPRSFLSHPVSECPLQAEKESDLVIPSCFTHFIDSHGSGSFLPESLFNLEEIVGQTLMILVLFFQNLYSIWKKLLDKLS